MSERRDWGASALLAAILAPLYFVQIRSYDFWWHLSTGRYIVRTGEIPTTDPFSYTVPGKDWLIVNWLGDLALYGSWTLGGAAAISALVAGVAWLALTFTGATLRRLEVGWPSAASVVVMSAVILQPRYASPRTYIFGWLLLSASIYVAVRWWRVGGRGHWLLAGLLALWLPTHGTAVLGAALVGVVWFAALLDRRDRRTVAALTANVAVCVALMALTRSGQDILAALTQGRSPEAVAVTSEARRLSLSEAQMWVPLAVMGLGVVYAGLRRRWLPAGLAALGLLVTLRAARGMPPGLVLAIPAFATLVAALAQGAARRSTARVGALLSALVAIAAVGAHVTFSARQGFQPLYDVWGPGIDADRFDEKALAKLQALPPARVIHNFEIGGWLMWAEVYDGVFADGRNNTLYDSADFARLVTGPVADSASLVATARAFDAKYGYVSHRAAMYSVMMSAARDWVPVHHGRSNSLFVRRDSLAATGARSVDPVRALPDNDAWTARWYDGVLRSPVGRRDLTAAIAQVARTEPESPALERTLRVLAARHPAYHAELMAALSR